MTGWARTRIYRNHHLDSTRWDAIEPRDGDVVITTSYKSGTTWTQHIVGQLLLRDVPNPPPTLMVSPWIDARFHLPLDALVGMVAAQTHRRFLKSHLAADGVPYRASTRYIVVARDTRDVFMSLVNHYAAYTDLALEKLNDDPTLPPLPRFDGDVHKLWRDWISRGSFDWESEGYPWWGNLHHTATYWPHRDLENVLLLHYNDLKADLAGEVRRIAAFLDVPLGDADVAEVVRESHIDRMREVASQSEGMLGAFFASGAKSFFFKGTNHRWRDVLDADDLALYEEAKRRVLTPECADWLERGAADRHRGR
jgi:aryl sulfotransferase